MLHWTCELTIQHCYFNHKPSAKNCYTTEARFAGMTKEEVIEYLEGRLMVVKGKQKLISYGELKTY